MLHKLAGTEGNFGNAPLGEAASRLEHDLAHAEASSGPTYWRPGGTACETRVDARLTAARYSRSDRATLIDAVRGLAIEW